jgi:hypothetical protein
VRLKSHPSRFIYFLTRSDLGGRIQKRPKRFARDDIAFFVRGVREIRGKEFPAKKSNAVGASHPDRIVRGFLLCLVTAGRWNDPLQPDSARALAGDECRICQSRLPIRDLTFDLQSLIFQSATVDLRS